MCAVNHNETPVADIELLPIVVVTPPGNVGDELRLMTVFEPRSPATLMAQWFRPEDFEYLQEDV
jgi:hypothetical protein